MGQATTAKVRLDTGKAARFTASAQSTGWFDDPSSPSAQYLPLPEKTSEGALLAAKSPGIWEMSTKRVSFLQL
jgi:hypothetical protein